MKPILFNTAMVRAILDGRKTVTRRVIKNQPIDSFDCKHELQTFMEMIPEFYPDDHSAACKKCGYGVCPSGESVYKPPCVPGDILYVRETWCRGLIECGEEPDGRDALYITQRDGENDIIFKEYASRNDIGMDDVKWRPSIFMPKEAARIFLRVTNVRVERLQDITAEEIQAEGVTSMCAMVGDMEIALQEWRNIWDSTIKEADMYGWDANPWVWVIEFERINKEETQALACTEEKK